MLARLGRMALQDRCFHRLDTRRILVCMILLRWLVGWSTPWIQGYSVHCHSTYTQCYTIVGCIGSP